MSEEGIRGANPAINEGSTSDPTPAREREALAMLLKLAMFSVGEAGLKPILSEIVEIGITISGADFGTIQLLDTNSSDLKIEAQRGFPQWWLDFWDGTNAGRGACGTALERGERVIVEDVERSPIFRGTYALEIQRRAGVRAVQSTPLVSRSGKPVGILSTHYRKPQFPHETVLQLLDLLASQGADIIERTRLETSLRESEERFRALVTASSDVVYRMSPDWTEMRYLSGKDFIADTKGPSCAWLQKYIDPEDQPKVMAAVNRAVAAKSIFELEHRVLQKDGTLGWTFSRAIPMLNAVGEIVEWFGTARDITARKQAEEKLRESEERFRVIFYQAAVGIAQTGINNQWMLLNDWLCEFLGYSRDELHGKTFIDITHPDDRELSLTAARMLLAGEISSWSSEKRYIRKSGDTAWARVFTSLVRDQHKQALYFVTIIEDIAQRKHAQEKLRESEERFRNMADAAPVMIWVSGPDKGCIFFNKVWLDFTGRTMEQELGNGWSEGVHPDDRDGCLTIYSSSFEARRSFRLEYRLRRVDGEYRWLLDNGVPRFARDGGFEGYIGSCIDITERKNEEGLREELQRERERLAEARGMERFRLSFEEAPVGMALIRGDGVWLRVNRALCEMTGYSETELVSRGRDITQADDRAEESLLLSRLGSGELKAGRLEERYLHKQGHTIYVLASIAAVERDDAGQPVHFVAHVQDLTERKRVEQELEVSRAQMVTNSRLSALGMMAGGIAHEINNPLTVIHASAANMVRMAESGSVPVPALMKNSKRIIQTADRISRIVRSLRHIAREGSADEFRETRVREIVDETLELCGERFRAQNIRLAISAVDPGAVIICREAQICQVLLNLLQNAFDELVDREGDRWVELDVTLDASWVTFSVRDSGLGIAPENRPHIMEPFFTTKEVGRGTGLGLSISRSIALEHGGSLELDEKSPHTCFRLKLPLWGS